MNKTERSEALRSLVVGLCNEILYCTKDADGPEEIVRDDIATFLAEMTRDETAALDFILKAGQDGNRWNSEVLPQNEALIPLLYALEFLLRKYKLLTLYGIEREAPPLKWLR